ncbi:hypothetical protein GGS21DRAFT_507004 [Xylaria nigripes]|nr:hypothetical protein GGS21DRAFT_507004 [Xylaria nigripes]
MDSFAHIASWSQHLPTSSHYRALGHFRSLSSMNPPNDSPHARSAKSLSSSNVFETMVSNGAGSLAPPQSQRRPSCQSLMEDTDHSTLPDPRVRAASPATGVASPVHHPDLDQEVATLSTKLINAINHQTTLDDTLSATRQELDTSHERVLELEALVRKQEEFLSGDTWVLRKNVEDDKRKLLARAAEEKNKRLEVEKEKRKIEQELETLTVSLFEEANKMVITAKEDAKREQDILQRKNEQLKAQLADTESLLRSQQEQLAQLKLVMEQMATDHDDHSGTAPSSPGFSNLDSRDDDTQVSEGASQSGILESCVPTYPMNLQHFIQPVLRTDLTAYEDFLSLIQTSKRTASRSSSGSYSSLPILSFSGNNTILASSSASVLSQSTTATLASTTIPPQTPNTPSSGISSGSTVSSTILPALKETKFYKRVLVEDIEPTLRLDIAPGLSWLARRSVLSAVTEGTLVVEPIPTNSPFASISRPQYYPCSLCGEVRKDEPHLRYHRFRTSESESAQRYPLCSYCLARVRSACDFLGFLRMVKDGHWRADNADSEKAAWEESVRLRDQMFWSRLGGGVVPIHNGHPHASVTGEKMARASHEMIQPRSTDNSTKESSEASSAPTLSCVAPPSDELSRGEQAPAPEQIISASISSVETVPSIEDDRSQLEAGTTEVNGHPEETVMESQGIDHGQHVTLPVPGESGTQSSA